MPYMKQFSAQIEPYTIYHIEIQELLVVVGYRLPARPVVLHRRTACGRLQLVLDWIPKRSFAGALLTQSEGL